LIRGQFYSANRSSEVDNALFATIPGIRRLNNCVKVFDEMEGIVPNSTGYSALELQG